MDIETAVVAIGVIVAYLAYLETVRREFKSDLKSQEDRLSKEIQQLDAELKTVQEKQHALDNRLHILETRVGYWEDDTSKSND